MSLDGTRAAVGYPDAAYYVNPPATRYGRVLAYNKFGAAWGAGAPLVPGALSGNMYRATASGWEEVSFGYELRFDAGSAIINEYDTITGATSSATGVVRRVVVESGTWGGSPAAAGRLIFATVSGTFQNNENLQVSSSTKAVADGTANAISLTGGGVYEFVNANFTGSSATNRMYGCNGKDRAFEFDGTVFVPLTTGTSSDTPEHIAHHKGHLFLSYSSSMVHSALGDPYNYTALAGAGEIACGDQITTMMPVTGSEAGGALVVGCENSLRVLYGTSTSDWNLGTISDSVGVRAHTMADLSGPLFMNDFGVTSLQRTQAFGNFDRSVITRPVQPIIDAYKGLVVGATTVRDKNQYRVFYSNGRTLVIVFDEQGRTAIGMLNYGIAPSCICSAQKSDGTEMVLVGSSTGMVYQADKGTSFDGEAITAWFRTAFNSVGSATGRKRFRRAFVNIDAPGHADIAAAYELGFGTAEVSQTAMSTVVGQNNYWDQFDWDQFFLDAQHVSDAGLDLTGTADNINFTFYSEGDYMEPHTVQSLAIHYTPRRLER